MKIPLAFLTLLILSSTSAHAAVDTDAVYACSASNGESLSFQIGQEVDNIETGVIHRGTATPLHPRNVAIPSLPVRVFVQPTGDVSFNFPDGNLVVLQNVNDQHQFDGHAELLDGSKPTLVCEKQ